MIYPKDCVNEDCSNVIYVGKHRLPLPLQCGNCIDKKDKIMIKNKIALDVDGILANFYLAACRRFNRPYISIKQWYLPWLTPEMFKILREDDNFWKQLPVLSPPESITFDFECYMTAVPKNQLESRKEWLINNGFPDNPIIISHKKHETCLKYGLNMIIDDKEQTLFDCEQAGIRSFRFIPPYFTDAPSSHSSYKIIRHLDEMHKYLYT